MSPLNSAPTSLPGAWPPWLRRRHGWGRLGRCSSEALPVTTVAGGRGVSLSHLGLGRRL